MSRKLIISLTIVVLIGIGGVFWYIDKVSNSHIFHIAIKAKNTTAKTHPAITPSLPSFDKTKYSLTDSTSIWVVVNKQHPLSPLNYVPPDLTDPTVTLRSPGQPNMQMRAVTATALEQMFDGAKQDNINLEVVSAYRSYSYQQTLYQGYVGSVGQASADQESARAGYSEHQSGLSVDIGDTDNVCVLSQCFGTTPEGEWLAANAYKYGFILRYPQGLEDITGYEYEPWHFRYVGTYLSDEMNQEHVQTLEQFFGVSGGTEYKD